MLAKTKSSQKKSVPDLRDAPPSANNPSKPNRRRKAMMGTPTGSVQQNQRSRQVRSTISGKYSYSISRSYLSKWVQKPIVDKRREKAVGKRLRSQLSDGEVESDGELLELTPKKNKKSTRCELLNVNSNSDDVTLGLGSATDHARRREKGVETASGPQRGPNLLDTSDYDVESSDEVQFRTYAAENLPLSQLKSHIGTRIPISEALNEEESFLDESMQGSGLILQDSAKQINERNIRTLVPANYATNSQRDIPIRKRTSNDGHPIQKRRIVGTEPDLEYVPSAEEVRDFKEGAEN